MGIDKQGKDSLNKPNQRGNENKPTPVTKQVNRTADKVEKVLKRK
jgi:hypothetical protein